MASARDDTCSLNFWRNFLKLVDKGTQKNELSPLGVGPYQCNRYAEDAEACKPFWRRSLSGGVECGHAGQKKRLENKKEVQSLVEDAIFMQGTLKEPVAQSFVA